MTARPPQRLRRCQLVFRQDHGQQRRCERLPHHLVELVHGERSQRLWVCHLHAEPTTYRGSGMTVRPVEAEIDDLIANDEGETL